MKSSLYLFIAVWMSVAVVLQLTIGCIDIALMAFPVNIVIIAVLSGLIFVANNEYGNSKIIGLLASKRMSVAALSIMAIATVIIGLVPQTADSRNAIVRRLGIDDFISSPVFYFAMLLLLVNLILVILRYNKDRSGIWRFRLNHIGFLLVLLGLGFGAADTCRLRNVVNVGETVNRAYDTDGKSKMLGYSFFLEDFNAEYYDNGVPSDFSVNAVVNDKQVEISVNHPYRASWQDDIYLVGYDENKGSESEYCIIEFIRQPWKYVVVAGVVMMALGALMLFRNGNNKRGAL